MRIDEGKGRCKGNTGGSVVRALASHQCGPGSNFDVDVDVDGFGLLLVLFVVGSLPGFSPGTPVFPSSQKSTLPNSYLFWNAWTLLSEFLRTSNSHCIAIALHSGRFETCIFVTGKWSVILTSHLCLLYYLKAKSFTYSNWGVGRGIKENRINKLY